MKALGLPVYEKNFEFCLLCSQVQTCDPWGVGKGPQGDVAYQISKFYAFQFQRRRILKMGFFVLTFQLVNPPPPGPGRASFDPGASNEQTW